MVEVAAVKVTVGADTSEFDAAMGRVDGRIDKLNSGLGAASTHAQKYTKSINYAGGSTANLAAQFNDIGVMLAAGQSPLLLAMQQGTQVNQVLGQMGTTGRDRLRALGAAFMSVVSPANLVTLGVIAGGAALIQWGLSAVRADEDGEDFEKTLKRLTSTTDQYRRATDDLKMGVSDLSREFGSNEAQARRLLEIQQRLAKARADMAFSAAATEAADMFKVSSGASGRDLIDAIDKYEALSESIAAAKEQLDLIRRGKAEGNTAGLLEDIANWEKLRSEVSKTYGQVYEFADQLGISQREMAALAAAAAEVSSATTIEDQVNAAQRLAEELDRVTGGFADGDEAAFSLYQKLLDAVRAGLELEGIDAATPIRTAAGEATRLADELNRALGNLISMQAQGISSLKESEIRLKYKGDPVATAGALAREQILTEQAPLREGAGAAETAYLDAQAAAYVRNTVATEENRQALIAWQKQQAETGRGSGGGGCADQLATALESLQDSLATETELLIDSYAEQQQIIQDAYAQRLIDQAEFQELSKRSAEEYASAMAQIDATRNDTALGQAGMFFGALETAFQNGNDKMLRIAKVAGAAEALINAWRAYSQTLADPKIGFWGKFAAAASVFSAGMGAVNAIKGVSTSGGGGGGSTTTPQSTGGGDVLNVSINPIDPNALYSGASVAGLLDALMDEAGDRGLRIVT